MWKSGKSLFLLIKNFLNRSAILFLMRFLYKKLIVPDPYND